MFRHILNNFHVLIYSKLISIYKTWSGLLIFFLIIINQINETLMKLKYLIMIKLYIIENHKSKTYLGYEIILVGYNQISMKKKLLYEELI